MKTIRNKFAILHSKDGKNKEIIYFPIIYKDVDSKNIFTYLNFQLNDTEEKFINIVKQQLRIEDSEIDSLRNDFLNFQNNSNQINFFIKETFKINNIIFFIAVNLIELKGLLFAQPDSFSRRAKSKNKFRRIWILKDLGIISEDTLNKFETEFCAMCGVKKKTYKQVIVVKWNNIMVNLLK